MIITRSDNTELAGGEDTTYITLAEVKQLLLQEVVCDLQCIIATNAYIHLVSRLHMRAQVQLEK